MTLFFFSFLMYVSRTPCPLRHKRLRDSSILYSELPKCFENIFIIHFYKIYKKILSITTSTTSDSTQKIKRCVYVVRLRRCKNYITNN